MKAIVNFVLGVVMFVLVVIWIIDLLVFKSKWLDKKAIVNFVLGVVMFVLVVIWIIALLVFNSKWLDKKTLTLKEFKIFFIDCIKENYL